MSETWAEINQKYLVERINEVKAHLKRHISRENWKPLQTREFQCIPESSKTDLTSIENLGLLFGLSSFEKEVVVLCAAVELDSETKALIAEAHGNPNNIYPTFELALACLPNGHWSALSPASPLRQFRLLEINSNTVASITTCSLHISERVLHYLTGVFYLEPQLRGIVKPVQESDMLVESHERVIRRILAICQDAKGKMPLIQLCGQDEVSKLSIGQSALAKIGLGVWLLPAELIPPKPDEAAALIQLWTREAALLGAGLYISAEDAEQATQKTIIRFAEDIPGPVFLGTRDRWQILANNAVFLEVNKPLLTEQRQLWQTNIKGENSSLDATVSALVGQFNLNTSAIKAAAQNATLLEKEGVSLQDALWQSACVVSRPRISELAQQITPKATLDCLVLPKREKQLLKEIAVHVAQRHRVYGDWGFQNFSSRGLGITVLFSGSSGTGKTMAAEVIANQLGLDLFRIDLSAVVSKYIGETEKNLHKLFDAAEDGGIILFFDEADALFGKRTEVKDSHDRYANIEINYLLQRMESYRGLAILATNMREALDQAFVRRVKFIVNFPFPDEKSREEIWKGIFPKETPTEGLDFERLAKLNVAGGTIRNIALFSAFLAANEGGAINMRHLKRAAQVEYGKLDRHLTQGEV